MDIRTLLILRYFLHSGSSEFIREDIYHQESQLEGCSNDTFERKSHIRSFTANADYPLWHMSELKSLPADNLSFQLLQIK